MVKDRTRKPAPIDTRKAHLDDAEFRRIIVEDEAADQSVAARHADRPVGAEAARRAEGNAACDKGRNGVVIAMNQSHTAMPPLS